MTNKITERNNPRLKLEVQKLIAKLYKKYMILFEVIAVSFGYTKDNYQDVVHSFFHEKILKKSSYVEILILFEQKGSQYAKQAFRNHLKDIAKKNIPHCTTDCLFDYGTTLDYQNYENEDIIALYKHLIENKFSKKYATIFEMTANGHSPKEINEITNFTGIYTAKSRIRKYLISILN